MARERLAELPFQTIKRTTGLSAASLCFLLFALAVLSLGVNAAFSFQQTPEAGSSRIDLRSNGTLNPHTITLSDVFTVRNITEAEISPDGTRVAFLVAQRFLDTNSERTALFVANASQPSAEPIRLCERDSISQVHWSPDGRFVTFVAEFSDAPGKSSSSQIWRISPDGGRAELLFRHNSGIAQYEWSPDGSKIAFTANRQLKALERASQDAGVVYDDNDLVPSFKMILRGDWHPDGAAHAQLWVYDVDHGDEQMFYETRNGFFQLRWSPDGRKIAITYLASPFSNNNSDIGVLSLKDRTFSPVVTWEGEDTNPSWSPDGERLAFASEGSIKGMAPFPVVDSVFVVNTNSPQTIVRAASGTGETRIWWDPGGKLLRLAMDTRTHSGLYEVPATGGRMKRILGSEDHAAQFSFDSSQGKVAFVVQNLTKPPNVGVLDLRTGTSATLTDLNPQFRNITMGQMSELTWKNQYGNETNGFLIKPVGYTAGRRYPLLLILYGFHREFTIQAQWIPDYPAQVFAANGFAVLLVNYPKMSKWRYGDFDEGFRNEVQNPLSSIERAVDLAERLGIADPHKVGIMGWSMGGFWTNLAVTYSHLFASASSGEAARRDPVAYWTQGSPFEDFLDGIVGGPPVSANYKHWRQYAPSLRKPLGRTPVLFEYQAGDPAGLETFESWRKQDAPVELVLYPNEGHVFVQPRHQLYSMQLNLDWFRFWLKGEEDNDPLKVDQYTRWRVLKKQAQQGTAN